MREETLSRDLVKKLETAFSKNLGWKLAMELPAVEKKMEGVCRELGYRELEPCLHSLAASMDEEAVQAVAREFSNGESYFFRDEELFSRLEAFFIPEILEKKRRRLNIWSVGCSGGEEAYSVAMLLRKKIPDIEKWDLFILGTDINPDALEKAEKGVFAKWSFRNTPEAYLRRCFRAVGQSYEIAPEIRKMVRFRYHNVADPAFLPLPPDRRGFDLILVRNVMIYFEPKRAKAAAEYLFSRLETGGWLATTAAEFGSGLFDSLLKRGTGEGPVIQKVSEWERGAVLDDAVPLPFAELFPPPAEAGEGEPDAVTSVDAAPKEETPPPPERIAPPDPLAYYTEAVGMADEGRNEEAKHYFRKSLYLDDGLVAAHIALGNLLKKEEKEEAARRHIGRAKELLSRMDPQEAVEFAGGMTAGDLLVMINGIKEERVG